MAYTSFQITFNHLTMTFKIIKLISSINKCLRQNCRRANVSLVKAYPAKVFLANQRNVKFSKVSPNVEIKYTLVKGMFSLDAFFIIAWIFMKFDYVIGSGKHHSH